MRDEKLTQRNWEAHGLPCIAIKHPTLGHWCGYVGLPAGHQYHGKDYDNIDVEVHGGLTYAEPHAPRKEPDGRWWVGFDCAHAGDYVPGLGRDFGDDVYRDEYFISVECERLAEQLAGAR